MAKFLARNRTIFAHTPRLMCNKCAKIARKVGAAELKPRFLFVAIVPVDGYYNNTYRVFFNLVYHMCAPIYSSAPISG